MVKRKVKVNRNFGKDAYVYVTNPESTYHNMEGRVVNGVLTMEGNYLVAFGQPTGDQFIFANDLELQAESSQQPPPSEPFKMDLQDAISYVPLDEIGPDPKQPRKTVDEKELQELAESIREHGLLQPILIRPDGAADDRFIIIFGERRWRASKLAGLTHISAHIREMNDEQALELQVIENLQRSDVHEMQEARAFKTLHARLTLEEIAHRIGKSKSYVSVRLRLNELIPDFQEIYLAGKMDFEDAQLLSRATPETQKHILTERADGREWEDEDWSLGNIEWLVRQASRNLDSANFKTEDPELYPEMGACGQCRYNSAVNELFGDVEGRICNLPVCYGIKSERSYALAVQEAAATPDMFVIAPYTYGDETQAKIKVATESGASVLTERDYRVVRPEVEPTWEEFLQTQDTDDEEWNEADARIEFEEEHKFWLEEQEELKRAKEEGLLKKAFVATGHDAGTYTEILLTKQGALKSLAAGATGYAAAEIGDILKREARSKEIDREKVTIRTYDLLKGPAGKSFNESVAPLRQPEWVALILFLWSYAPFEIRGQIQTELGLEQHHMTRGSMLLYQAVSQLTIIDLEATLQRLIRPLILQQFAVRDNPDYHRHGECAVIRDIALDYLPEVMKEVDGDQEKVATKRIARVEQRIAELRGPAAPTGATAEPQRIRAERGRNIIKVQSTDSTQAWKKLEGPFDTADAMNSRYQELLSTGKCVEG